jgi:CheY-like chemotaxis protein
VSTRGKKDILILIADDSESFRINTGNLLKGVGYGVSFAKDGDSAIKVLEKNPSGIDLLILDLQMPKVDGYGVLEWMRWNDRVGNPPVLALTGAYKTDMHAVIEELKKLGAKGLLTKSADKEQFIIRANEIIFKKEMEQGEELREHPRIPTDIDVDFIGGVKMITGRILDISCSGAFIKTSDVLQPRETIKLRFFLPEEDSELEVDCKITWVSWLSKTEGYSNGLGVRFGKISPENNALIASFVEKELNRNN